jgi:uncharacterized membrane protein YesL
MLKGFVDAQKSFWREFKENWKGCTLLYLLLIGTSLITGISAVLLLLGLTLIVVILVLLTLIKLGIEHLYNKYERSDTDERRTNNNDN